MGAVSSELDFSLFRDFSATEFPVGGGDGEAVEDTRGLSEPDCRFSCSEVEDVGHLSDCSLSTLVGTAKIRSRLI